MRTRRATLVTLAPIALAVVAIAVGASLLLRGGHDFRNSPDASRTLDRIDPAQASELALAGDGEIAPLPAPAPTPEAAVRGLLDALVARDADASFGLLSAGDREALGPLPSWRDRLSTMPRYLHYEVIAADALTVTTDVVREPHLDAVNGYVPAKARSTWSTVAEDGGYRVTLAGSTTEPQLPTAAAATEAAQRWVDAQQACRTGQSYDGNLLGQPTLADALCDAERTYRAGAPVGLEQFRDPTVVLNAFGADAPTFVRIVPVDGPVPFQLALAPLGPDWEVIGLLQT